MKSNMVISRATMINLMRAAELGADSLMDVPDFRRAYLFGLASELSRTFMRSSSEFVELAIDEN